MRNIAHILVLAVAATAWGCGTHRAALAPSGEQYSVLGESEDGWIVKIPKERGGQEAAERAASELRSRSSEAVAPAPAPVAEREDSAAAPPAEEPPPAAAGDSEPSTSARVTGRIARQGQGVAGCEVRLVPMQRSFVGLYWEEALERERILTTTDEGGEYAFENVPPGAYRLKWLTPGAGWWVKRLSEEPDAVVEAGQAVRVKEVDTSRRTLE